MVSKNDVHTMDGVNSNRIKIADYIKNNPHFTYRKMAKDLGIKSLSTIQWHIKKLKEENDIINLKWRNNILRSALNKIIEEAGFYGSTHAIEIAQDATYNELWVENLTKDSNNDLS